MRPPSTFIRLRLGPRDHERFRKHQPAGQRDACWEWTGLFDASGYGRLYLLSPCCKYVRAHRVAYQLSYGAVPPGKLICHRCDNRKCVNPRHLFVGDDKSNYDDMCSKGRRNPRYGTHNGRASLSEKQIRKIRTLRKSGVQLKILAKAFAVWPGTISSICRGRLWKHLPL